LSSDWWKFRTCPALVLSTIGLHWASRFFWENSTPYPRRCHKTISSNGDCRGVVSSVWGGRKRPLESIVRFRETEGLGPLGFPTRGPAGTQGDGIDPTEPNRSKELDQP
jgi:hypothetical protein